MPLFAQNKTIGVQSFILNLVNNNCPDLHVLDDGPRLASRVNLTMVVLIVPVEDGRPMLEESFTTVTKEFSNTGLAVVLAEPLGLDQVILGFRRERELTFVRATAKHLNPMGGGFHQLGFHLNEVVHPGEYPELQEFSF